MNRMEGGDGFTLLEILIVVALIGLLAGFFLSFPSTTPGALRHSGRVVAAELGYAAQRAISTGRPHRWLIDLDRQTFRIEEQAERGEPRATELPTHAELLDLSPPSSLREYAPVENRSGEWRWLDDTDVAIDEVLIGDDSYAEGQAAVAFSPDGGADPAEVWLRDAAGREMRARVVAFTGEIHLEDTRVSEPERSDAGFTLLEVLIAVFVLGTVLGALVTLVGGNLARLSDARGELLEMRLAEQRVRELEDEFQSGQEVTDGVDTGRFEEPNDGIAWQVLVEPYRLPIPPGYEDIGAASPLFETAEPSAEVVLRRVEVRVFRVESEPEAAKPVVILIPEPLAEAEVADEGSS